MTRNSLAGAMAAASLFAFCAAAPEAAGSLAEETQDAGQHAGQQGGAEQRAERHAGDTAVVEAWLKRYDAAFNAKDLDTLATFYHPDVTVYEGGGINTGWADYRDRHLGPELKQFQNLQFSHADIKATPLGDGSAAYATATYSLEARMGGRVVDSSGLATYVLIQDSTGAWKIRHSHTSSRPRRAQ